MTFRPDPKPEPRKKKTKKRISPISEKEKERKKQYKPLRDQFLLDHPICQACNFKHSDQVHHMEGKIGDLLCDTNNFLAVCFGCHRVIEENPNLAKENNWSVSRLNKGK